MKRIATFHFIIVCLGFLILLQSPVTAQQTESAEQFLYAQKLMEDGLMDLAASQFEDYLRLYPDSPQVPEAQFQLGELYGKLRQWRKSSEIFRRLMVKYPAFPRCDEALFKIAGNHVKMQENKKAIDILERLSLFYPKSEFAPKAYLLAGQLWLQEKSFIRAEEIWKRVLQEYPQSQMVRQARYLLANLYFQSRDYSAAQAQIDQILEMDPDADTFIKVGILKAKIFGKKYQIDQAEQLYQTVSKMKGAPDNQIRALLAYATFLNGENRFEECKKILEPILARQFSPSLRDSLILIFVKNEYDLNNDQGVLEAVNTYQHNLRDSLSLAALLDTGIRSAVRSANHVFATDLLRKRLSFEKIDRSDKPLIKQYHVLLLEQLREQNLFADVLQHGERILSWDWQDREFVNQVKFLLAELYRVQLDQPGQALFYYEQIIAPGQKSKLADEAAYGLAQCYEELNDTDRARQIYRNFAYAFPGSSLILEVNKKLRWYRMYRPEKKTGNINQSAVLIASMLLEGENENAILELLNQLFTLEKDYSGVIKLGEMIESKNALPNSRDQLIRLLGESYYRLAKSTADSSLRMEQFDKARAYLVQYLPVVTENAEKVRIALLIHEIDRQKHQLTTIDFLTEYEFLTTLINRFPDEKAINSTRLELGKLLHKYGLRVSRDSITAAIKQFSTIIETTSNSPENLNNHSISAARHVLTAEEEALYFRSTAYFDLSDTAKAQFDLEKYRNLFPRGRYIIPVLTRLGDLYSARKNWQAAERIYSDFQSKFYYASVADSAQIRLARLKIKLEKYDEAISLLQPFTAHDEAVFLMALAYQKMGRSEQARSLYFNYLERFPDGQLIADVYFNLALLARQNGQLQEEAFYEEHFLKHFATDPRAVEIQMWQADQLFSMNKFAESLSAYANLLKKYPDDQALQKRRILTSIKLGKISASRAAIEQFKKQFDDPREDLAELEYEIGNYFLEQKSFENAEKQFKQTKSRYKNTIYSVYADYGRGKLKIITNHTEDGLDILTKLIEKNENHPVLPELYLTLGDFYYKTKQFGQAIAAFNKILELAPPRDIERVARKYQVKIYSDVGQYESALIALRRFLDRFPEDEEAFVYKINLGVLLINLNEYGRAIEHLQSLLPMANNEYEAEIRYHIAKSYFNWGQFRKAISEYLKVTYLTRPTKLPWHVTSEYEAGLAYMKLEEWDRARDLFDNIVKKEGAGSDFGRFALMKMQEVEQLRKK